MSSSSESEHNPYTPPASECVAVLPEPPPLLNRPASNRWALFIFGLVLFGIPILFLEDIAKDGFSQAATNLLNNSPLTHALYAMNALAFVVMLRLRQRPPAYWIANIVLFWFLWNAIKPVKSLLANWKFVDFTSATTHESLLELLLSTIGIVYLICRFTLGRANRQYYGLAPTPINKNAAIDA